MAEFNRFDICDAYCVLEWDYNLGGWLRERPSNQRRSQATSVQLLRMAFKPSMDLSYENMSDNAKEIYRAAEARYGLRKTRIQQERYAVVKCLTRLSLFEVEEIVDFDRMTPNGLLTASTLISKTLTRSLNHCEADDFEFEKAVAELETVVADLADTLNWLFDEPIAAPIEPRGPLVIISAIYNSNGYAILMDDVEICRAGNSPYSPTETVKAEQGLSLERIRIMAGKTAQDECRKRNGIFAGAKEVLNLN